MPRPPSSDCLDQLAEFATLLPQMHTAFRLLEVKVPPPLPTVVYGRIYPRHQQQTSYQAALQKATRYLSGLKSLNILLAHRMLQEEGSIKRTLDELGDDIMFLLMPPENPDEEALRSRWFA